MLKRLLFVIVICLTLGLGVSIASADDCLMCAKDSTDKCAEHQQCRGTRAHCRSIGCKITGTSSCSTAANVKICSSVAGELEPMMSHRDYGMTFESPCALR